MVSGVKIPSTFHFTITELRSKYSNISLIALSAVELTVAAILSERIVYRYTPLNIGITIISYSPGSTDCIDLGRKQTSAP